ncbi:MAG: DUF58 domain-containing protein [Porphyromonadaceae bacterium]|nr:DUF58 domain-containing protein [Porphyromonadaceae bacterium]
MKQGLDHSDLLKRVRKIEIKAKGLSEQVFAGQYHSAFRGRGMAFSEVRGYQIGDDVRDIDWNVTARYAHPFVKVFHEERELSVMLLIDLSGSIDWGTQRKSKLELVVELTATLAFSAIQNNDKIGAIFFTDSIELFVPPRSGRKHILYIVRELLTFTPRGRDTNLNVPLNYLMRIIKKRCTAFVISDFLHSREDYQTSLSLAARKHDLVALRVSDPQESNLPLLGLMQLYDAETGTSTWVDACHRRLRLHYAQTYEEQSAQCQDYCLRAGVQLANLSTGADFVPELIRLFRKRI